MRTLAVALVAVLAADVVSASRLTVQSPLRVFVFTSEAPSGVVDEQLIARKESLRDLAQALTGEKYRGVFTLVPSRAQADVVIEVVSRGERSASAGSSAARAVNGGQASHSQSSSISTRFLTVRLSSARGTHDLTTEGQPKTWLAMAELAAADVAAWTAASLPQTRQPATR